MPDPVLHTERLTLRPLTAALAADLTSTSALGTDDDLAPLLAGVVANGAAAQGIWLVVHDGVPVGTVGAAGHVSPGGDQELGYAILPSARGRGLATEAVAAVCGQLERRDGVLRLTAEVRPGNSPSLRVLHRLGFVPVEGGATGHQLLARAAPGRPALRPHLAGRHVC